MKNHTILGALMCFAIACFAQPAIAAPIESPPKAQPAQENFNALAANFEFANAGERSSAWQPVSAQDHVFAILADYKIADAPTVIFRRCMDASPVAFRAIVKLRQMTTAPPEG